VYKGLGRTYSVELAELHQPVAKRINNETVRINRQPVFAIQPPSFLTSIAQDLVMPHPPSPDRRVSVAGKTMMHIQNPLWLHQNISMQKYYHVVFDQTLSNCHAMSSISVFQQVESLADRQLSWPVTTTILAGYLPETGPGRNEVYSIALP
jgi:hypothetical protein